MIRRGIVAFAALTLGCGSSAMPPAGPTHVPEGSAEAATACPKERAQAQAAREALLGESSEALLKEAGERVFAHGQCEAKALAEMPVPTGTHDQILEGLRKMRGQMQDAGNLFGEVTRYGEGLLALRASVAGAATTLQFANRVSATAPPSEMDLQGRQAFASELADAVRTLHLEASMRLKESLELARTTPASEPVTREACQLLATIEEQAAGCP